MHGRVVVKVKVKVCNDSFVGARLVTPASCRCLGIGGRDKSRPYVSSASSRNLGCPRTSSKSTMETVISNMPIMATLAGVERLRMA